MEAVAVKSNKRNKSEAIANSVSQKKSNGQGAFEFADNRPGAFAQRKLNAMINNSSRVAAQHRQKSNIMPANKAVIQRITNIAYGDTVGYHYDWPARPILHPLVMAQNAQFATHMRADLDLNYPVQGSGPTEAGEQRQAREDTRTKHRRDWVL